MELVKVGWIRDLVFVREDTHFLLSMYATSMYSMLPTRFDARSIYSILLLDFALHMTYVHYCRLTLLSACVLDHQ